MNDGRTKVKTLAEQLGGANPILEYAVVVKETDEGYVVQTAYAASPVRRAAGCLLDPQVNDRVLVCLDEAGPGYVLSVLERGEAAGAPSRLSFPGDVTLAAPEGSVRLAARESLDLSGRKMRINAHEAEARIEVFYMIGRFWHAQIERAKTVGHTLDSIFHRLVSRLNSSYRYIEDHEEVQAASKRYLIDGTMTIQTRNTVHTAEEHIKIDADQIHLA